MRQKVAVVPTILGPAHIEMWPRLVFPAPVKPTLILAVGGAGLQIYRYPVGPTVAPGDANGDGAVNVLDLAFTARIIVGLEPNGDLHPGADANQDGYIDMGDVTRIERIILGLV